jgi:hypothetical protein
MSEPWEDYKPQANNDSSGPWADYAQPTSTAREPDEHSKLSFSQKLLKLLEPVAQVADWTGGMVRTGVGEAAGAVTGSDVVRDGDWMQALQGKAIDTNTIMDRAGVPQGGQLSDLIPGMYSESGDGLLTLQKGGMLDPSPRGVAGFVGDVALDPLTYLTAGGSTLAKTGKAGAAAEKVLKPASNLMEAGGKSMYKSGLTRIDQEAMKYGKDPVSDVLLKHDIAGSANTIYNKMRELSENLVGQQKGLLSQADEAGKTVDMTQSMRLADEEIANMRLSRDPRKQAAAATLQDEVASYKTLDSLPPGAEGPIMPVGVQQANDFKTSLYQSIPQGDWAETLSGLDPQLIKGRKAQARGLKESVEGAVDGIGKGAEIRQINDELGRLLTTNDKAWNEAIKEQNKNIFSSVDGGLLGIAISDPGKAAILLAKKAADAAKMTGPRTVGGQMLRNQGRGQLSGPIWDILLRQQMIEANRDEQP